MVASLFSSLMPYSGSSKSTPLVACQHYQIGVERSDLQNDQLNSIFFAFLSNCVKTIGIYATVAVGDQDNLACVCQLLGDSLDHVNGYNEGRDRLSSQHDEAGTQHIRRTITNISAAGHKLLFESAHIWH